MPQIFENDSNGVAAIGSMTAALKAQHALAAAGLHLSVVSLSPGENRRGCAYGIEYPLHLEEKVRTALRAARVPVSQYLRKGGQRL